MDTGCHGAAGCGVRICGMVRVRVRIRVRVKIELVTVLM